MTKFDLEELRNEYDKRVWRFNPLGIEVSAIRTFNDMAFKSNLVMPKQR